MRTRVIFYMDELEDYDRLTNQIMYLGGYDMEIEEVPDEASPEMPRRTKKKKES